MRKASSILCALAAVAMIAAPLTGEARQPRVQKTAKQTQQMRRAALRQQRQKVRGLQRTLNGMAKVASEMSTRVGVDLAIEPGAQRQIQRLINEHGRAMRELTRLRKQSLVQFADTGQIEIIPSPPSTPPPPLPGETRSAPRSSDNLRKPDISQSKSWLPPGSSSPRVYYQRTRF